MIGIFNTEAQNIGSIKNCLEYLNIKYQLVDSKNINKFSHYILPGVGSYDKVLKSLKRNYSINTVKKIIDKKKILAICVGFQILFKNSDEGKEDGLGFFNQKIINLKKVDNKQNIPHVGFNSVSRNNLNLGDYYFTHSFGALYEKQKFPESVKLFHTNYGKSKIITMIERQNLIATQFHPEKSGSNGLNLIINFYAKKKNNI